MMFGGVEWVAPITGLVLRSLALLEREADCCLDGSAT